MEISPWAGVLWFDFFLQCGVGWDFAGLLTASGLHPAVLQCNSLLFAEGIAGLELGIVNVAFVIGLGMLSEYDIFASLPLRRHPWQKAGVFLLPSIVLIFAIRNFEACIV